MDVTDYNSKLANAKHSFSEQTEKLRSNFQDKEVQLGKLHEATEKNQRDVYLKERQDMKETFATIADDQSLHVKKEIEEGTKRFIQKNEDQLHDFNIDRRKNKMQYDEKLSNLKSSFDRTLKERGREFDRNIKKSQKMFDERSSRNEKSAHDKVRSFTLSSQDSFSKIKDEFSQEKLSIQLRDQKINQKLIKDGHLKAAEKRKMQDEQLKNIKFNNERNIGMLKKHQSENVLKMTGQKEMEVVALKNNFERLTNNLTDKFQDDREFSKKENLAIMMEKNRVQAKELESLRNETRAKITGGTRLDNQVNQEKRMIGSYENRLKHLKNKLREVKYNTQEDKLRMNKKNQNQIADLAKLNNKKLDSKDGELREYRDEIVKESHEEMLKTIDTYKQELNASRLEQIQQGLSTADNFKQLLNSRRNEYSRNMADIQQKNIDIISDVQDDNRRESAKIAEDNKKKTHSEMAALRRDFKNSWEKKEESLNKRLDSSLKENSSLINRYETRVENIRKKSAEEIENIKVLSNDRRSTDREGFKRELEGVNKKMKMELGQLKNQFEGQLSSLKNDQDKNVTKLVRKYESQLTNERKEHHRTMTRRLNTARVNYEKLFGQSELEKMALTNRYENQISTIKEAYQEQTEERAFQRANALDARKS